MSRIRHILQWIANRATIIFATVTFSVAVMAIWMLDSNNPTPETLAIKIASISAFFAAVSSVATLVQAIETQKQRRNLERPYILADFDVASDGEINFITQNIGNAPAFNVSVKFSQPAPVDFANRPLGFAEPIKFLAPGKSVRQLMGSALTLFKDDKPTKFRLSISYTSAYHELFTETIDHDLSYLKGTLFPEKSIQESLGDISRQLSTIANRASSPTGLWSPPSVEYSLVAISKELKQLNARIPQQSSFSWWKVIVSILGRRDSAKE